MIYTPTTKKAIKLMFEKHKNQVDKSGMPYVFHPMHVAESMEDENTTVVNKDGRPAGSKSYMWVYRSGHSVSERTDRSL